MTSMAFVGNFPILGNGIRIIWDIIGHCIDFPGCETKENSFAIVTKGDDVMNYCVNNA